MTNGVILNNISLLPLIIIANYIWQLRTKEELSIYNAQNANSVHKKYLSILTYATDIFVVTL